MHYSYVKIASRRLILSLLGVTTLCVGTAFAGAISANGTCELGNCTTPDSLPAGQTTIAPFNFTYTFANTDQYSVSGAFAAAYKTSTVIAEDVTVSYLGNSSSTASGADTLVLDFLQNFATTGFPPSENNTGFESMNGTMSGPLGAGTSIQGQYFTNNGTGMAVMGPFSTASFSSSFTDQPYSFGPTTLVEFTDTFAFGAGTGVGGQINVLTPNVSTIPEPSSLLLLGSGAILLLSRSRRLLAKR
jgi:hypothetical protein